MSHSTYFRTVALVLTVVLLVVAATPAKAEALEPLAIIAIASLVVAGIVLVAYLIIANTEGERRADEGRVIWVAQSPES
jgi:general stress protein CsbA